MIHLITTVVGLVLFATPTAAQPAQPQQPTADIVLATVQSFYASVPQVTAQFRQTVKVASFGTTKDSDGKVYLEKPGKMRWDYLVKKGKTVQHEKEFISDGTTLYLVEHNNMQVTTMSIKQNMMPVVVSFLYGKGNLKSEFNAVLDTSGTYGTKGDHVLKLTPKQPSAQYKTLTLVVDPTDGHVRESIIIDPSNNVSDFKFYNPDFKTPIAATVFQFNPASVKSYRIINANQQGSGAGSAAPPPPAPAAPKKP
jgi:outer membrane lipoprotein carrier protein